MTKPADDLEAVRVITEAVEGFEPEDKERIIRWALERLKLLHLAGPSTHLQPQVQQPPTTTVPPAVNTGIKDLRTFVDEKQPKSDVQFAATVAFYHRFEAPADQRKENVNAEDLKEACRLVNRERLKNPLQTLSNARNLGLLDSAGRGLFTINSVGENLVAMTLPSTPGNTRPKNKRAAKKKAAKSYK